MTDIEKFYDEARWLLGKERVSLQGASVTSRPATPRETLAIVRAAAKHRLPVGTRPNAPCRLDLALMNSILDWDLENGAALVEAGVACDRLHQFTYERGFLCPLPLRPTTLAEWAETGDHGVGALRLGGPLDTITSLHAITLEGVPIETGPYRIAPAGIDLRPLYIGAQRTLGIITAVGLRLHPRGTLRGLAYTLPDTDKLTALLRATARLPNLPLHAEWNTEPTPTLRVLLAGDEDLLPEEEKTMDTLAAQHGAARLPSNPPPGTSNWQTQSRSIWNTTHQPWTPEPTPEGGQTVPLSRLSGGLSPCGMLAGRHQAVLYTPEAPPPREGFLKIAKMARETLDPQKIYGAY
ncbi:MAG: FAD-binding oxidoreductase [Euryarchaeota archaeon]|nr:FAD-binding oxidoreductase [Euryarchaeota archaeon]